MAFKKKNELAPKEDDILTEEEINSMIENPEDITESSGLDAYEKVQLNEIKKELKEAEKEPLQKEILNLRGDVEQLKEENDRLRKELEESKSGEHDSGVDVNMKEKIEKLDFENDELILKNSELEFEISRLKAENTRLNSELEKLSKQYSNSHNTYTPQNYDRTGTVKSVGLGTKVYCGMNGYQDWR